MDYIHIVNRQRVIIHLNLVIFLLKNNRAIKNLLYCDFDGYRQL